MQFTSLALSAVLAALAQADGPTDSFNSSDLETLNMSSSPTFVSQTIRNAWCTSQRFACSTLCGSGGFGSNACDANALTWNCTCASNNSAPGLQWYATTMPNSLCEALNGNCVAANAQNGVTAQQNCNSTYACSNLNITNFAASASASASGAMSTAKPTGSATGTGSASSPTSSKSAAIAALHVGEHYGAGVLGAGLVAALGFLL